VESGQYQNANSGRLPDWYVKKPAEVRGDDFWLRAFADLCSERAFGTAIGPIPWSKIVMYGERKGLDRAMIGVLEVLIREMDEVYLSDLRETQRHKEQDQARKAKRSKSTLKR
jgi:hypothetical protein